MSDIKQKSVGDRLVDKLEALGIDPEKFLSTPLPQAHEDEPWGQVSIKGPLSTVEKFKQMAKADRRSYYGMLEILMENHEIFLEENKVA